MVGIGKFWSSHEAVIEFSLINTNYSINGRSGHRINANFIELNIIAENIYTDKTLKISAIRVISGQKRKKKLSTNYAN